MRENPESLKLLESWLQSYKPQELFDANGRLIEELRELAPNGARRMSANPHANGGLLRKDLKLPDFRQYAVSVPTAGTIRYENTKPLGEFLRDVMRANMGRFRVFGPDETASNRSAGGVRSLQEDVDGATCCRRTPTAASWRATGA